jgi:pyroglutamyl-peptidase
MTFSILITGFGPFPGAPFNPTVSLVARLAKQRRPALAEATIVAHVFPTSYAAVDRELPGLIAQHRPDVLLMFGLAAGRKTLCIETRARNALAHSPDVGGGVPRGGQILPGGPPEMAMPAPARRLLATLRGAHVPARLSRDAGRYLCNYLCWRAAEAARRPAGPRLAAFVHIPAIARWPRRRSKHRMLKLDDLARAGSALLAAIAARHVSDRKPH